MPKLRRTIEIAERAKLAALMPRDESWFDVRDYGAEVDGVWLYDAEMTSSDATLTSATASFTSADVGKIIWIGSYAHNANPLVVQPAIQMQKVGTITAVNSGTSVECSFTASATVPSANRVTVCCYGTNDLAAWRAAMLAAEANNGGTIFQPWGTSLVWAAGADFATADDHQSLIPVAQYYAGEDTDGTVNSGIRNIRIKGSMPQGLAELPLAGAQAMLSGSVLFAPVLDTGASTLFPNIIGGTHSIPGAYQSLVRLLIEDMNFRLPNNPAMTAVDGFRLGGMEVHNSTATIDAIGFDAVQPTHTHAKGFMMPADNNFADSVMSQVYVVGFYSGYRLSEHANLFNVYSQCCYHGMDYYTGGYEGEMTDVLFSGCPYGLYFDGTTVDTRIKINHLIIESTSGFSDSLWPAWTHEIATIYDPNNHLHGEITFHCNQAYVGDTDGIIVNGGTNVLLRALAQVGTRQLRQTSSNEAITLVNGSFVKSSLYIEAKSGGDGMVSASGLVQLTGVTGQVYLTAIIYDSDFAVGVLGTETLLVYEGSASNITMKIPFAIPLSRYRHASGNKDTPPKYYLQFLLGGSGTVSTCYLIYENVGRAFIQGISP